MDPLSAHITALAHAYANHTGASLSTIGAKAANNWGIFAKIASGHHSLTLRRYQTIVDWFQINWPRDLPWPEHPATNPKIAPTSERVRDQDHIPATIRTGDAA